MEVLGGILGSVGMLLLALLFIDQRRHPQRAVVFVVLFTVSILLIHPLLKCFGMLLPMAVPPLLAGYVLLARKRQR
jgi:predicted membrane channel-forming protein YqfA (hemolysin III family)